MSTFGAKAFISKILFPELVILFLLMLVINNYIGNVDRRITADGIGYYDYLPSIFIHNDLLRKDKDVNDETANARINKLPQYVDYNEFKVNKYPIGTAILQSPFFAGALLSTKLDGTSEDGYQEPFQKAMFYSAIFYLFLTIVFFRKLLCFYNVKWHIIFIFQVILVFATPLIHYVNVDCAFSHVYSLFAITAFGYYLKKFQVKATPSNFALLAFVFSYVILIRQINIVIVAIIPFLLGSKADLVRFIKLVFSTPSYVISGLFTFILLFSIQCLAWYFQTGSFILYSYQGEGFNFMSPMFISILFSYKKGLLVYTPVFVLVILSTFEFIRQKHYYLFFSYLLFFVLLTYVLSSWHCWFYGCSFGLRAYIDFMSLLFIPLILLLDRIRGFYLISICITLLVLSAVNILQAYQYKEYILHWNDMSKAKYWKVFLKTNEQYKGLIWKTLMPVNQYQVLLDTTICAPSQGMNKTTDLCSINCPQLSPNQTLKIIRLSFDYVFDIDDDTKLGITVFSDNCDSCIIFQHAPYLIHFAPFESTFTQHGVYDFQITAYQGNPSKIVVSLYTKKRKAFIKYLNIKVLTNKI